MGSSLVLTACQAPIQRTAPQQHISSQAQSVNLVAQNIQSQNVKTALPLILPQSPVLEPVQIRPQGSISVRNNKVNVNIQLPPLPDSFKTQALDLSAAAKIVATVTDSHGKTYQPDGHTAGEVDYPITGALNLTFSDIIPDALLMVELQVKDGTGNIPQANLASVVSQTGTADVNAVINFQTTPTALAMKALVATDADRARLIDLPALVTKMAEITGVSGTTPNFSYTTHPTLVNTAQMATDLAGSQPALLTAADYRLNGATVAVTVQGLVGSDTMEVQVTDAASARATALGNGLTAIAGATPGTGVNVLMGATTAPANSTQYTFAASTNPLTLTESATVAVTVTATPVAINVTNMAPAFGTVGDTITLTGTGFSTVAANNTVKFGSITVPTTDVTVNGTGTQITAKVPDGIFNTQSVTVEVGATTSNGSDFEVTPRITSLDVGFAKIGGNVEIRGDGFSTTASENIVRFGSVLASNVTVLTSKHLRAQVPPGLFGQPNLTVQVGNQTSTASIFRIQGFISSISSNTATPDTVITLTGSGFSGVASDNRVRFGTGGAVVIPTSVNAAKTMLTFAVPNREGTKAIEAFELNGVPSNDPVTFNFVPKITSLSRTSSFAGQGLIISGKGFDPTENDNNVRFGTTSATVNSSNRTNINVTTPEMPAGDYALTVGVETQTSAPTSYEILPSISNMSTAAVEDGKPVLIRSEVLTITGNNFDPTAANNTVRFGNETPVAVQTASPNSITVVVPDNAKTRTRGNVPVRVITNGKTSSSKLAIVSSVQLDITNGGFY